MGFATGYSVYSGIVGSNKYIKSDDKNINLFLESTWFYFRKLLW